MNCGVEESRPERKLTRTLCTNELRRNRLTNSDLQDGGVTCRTVGSPGWNFMAE